MKHEEMEEPDFGDAEKSPPTEGEDAAMDDRAAILLKPPNDLLRDSQRATSDGEAPRPHAVRSRSTPRQVGKGQSLEFVLGLVILSQLGADRHLGLRRH